MATGNLAVAATGNPDIDGLLNGFRWNATNVLFNFPTLASFYPTGYGATTSTGYTPVNFPDGFVTVSASFQAMVRAALAEYSAVTLLTFIEVGASDAASNVSVARTTGLGTSTGLGNDFNGWGFGPGSNARSGDIWFDDQTAKVGDSQIVGRGTFRLVLHELGHAMGLKHGQDTGGVANTAVPASKDFNDYTLMSYRRFEGGPITGTAQEVPGNTQSLMMLDILALQIMYGANFATNAGATTYTWSPTTGQMFINGQGGAVPGNGATGTNRIYRTLWDGGGLDTYDLSNYATNLSIDLTPGGKSIFDSAQLAIVDTPTGRTATGNLFNALQFNGDARSLIENAIGGGGNDTIIGNAAANELRGAAGNDTLLGGAGNDTLDGGAETDTARYGLARAGNIVTRNADGSIQVSGGPSIGFDTLTNIERVDFTDGDLIYDIAFTADPALVYRIYQAAFARVPDEPGFRYWEGVHRVNGLGFLDMAAQFRTSQEFIQKYGANVTNNNYVTALYTNVLQRTPDAGGLAFWQGVLNSGGASRDQLLLDFAASAENVTLTTPNIANGYWVT